MDDCLEQCAQRELRPRLISFDRALILQFPFLRSGTDFRRGRLTVIALPTTLITLHEQPVAVLSNVAGELAGEAHFQVPTNAGLLHHLLDRVVDALLLIGLDLRTEVEVFARALDDGRNEEHGLPQLLSVKKRVTALLNVYEDQLYCLAALRSVDTPAFPARPLHDYLTDLSDNVDHGIRSATRLGAQVNDLQLQFHLQLQGQSDNRLRLLTILSAVFLPLTLLTGIYGMNFRHMPELEAWFGYPAILALMGLVAGGMLLFFVRRGWFK